MDDIIKIDRQIAFLRLFGIAFALVSISFQTVNFDYIDTFSVALTEIMLLIFLTISDHNSIRWRNESIKSAMIRSILQEQVLTQDTLINKLKLKIYKLEKGE